MFSKFSKIALLIALVLTPLSASLAAGIPSWGDSQNWGVPSSEKYDTSLTEAGGTQANINVAISNYIDFFLYLVATLLLIAMVYGGWEYLTAYGDSDKASKGIKAISLAVVGLIIVTISYAATKLLVTGLPKGNVNACETRACVQDSDCNDMFFGQDGVCRDNCCSTF